MESYNIIETKKTRDQVIIHEVKTENGIETFKYSGVRAGLNWPTASMPAYYCILGEEWLDIDHDDPEKRRGKLRLFAEYEFSDLSLDPFFARLTDDTALYHCKDISCNMEEAYTDFVEEFNEYAYRKQIKMGALDQAPYADNFRTGMSRIKNWMDSGIFKAPEKSIIYTQLKMIEKSDLGESPETKFHVLNALRFVIAAFQKYPVHHSPPRYTNPMGGEHSWMTM